MTLAANARPRNPCVDAGRLRLQTGKHGKENIHLEAQLPHGLARGRERAPLPSCCSADSASAIAQRSAHSESHTILRRKRPVLVNLSLARVARRNGLVSKDSLAFDTAASRQGSCPSRLCWVIESRFLRSRDVAPVFLCLPCTVSRANQKSAAGTQNPSAPPAHPWFPRLKTHRLGHRRACPVRFLLSLLERQSRHSTVAIKKDTRSAKLRWQHGAHPAGGVRTRRDFGRLQVRQQHTWCTLAFKLTLLCS